MTKVQIEQLSDIVQRGPVFAGDLISKQAKNDLVAMGFVRYFRGYGNDAGIHDDGLRLGGFVATPDGVAALYEATNLGFGD